MKLTIFPRLRAYVARETRRVLPPVRLYMYHPGYIVRFGGGEMLAYNFRTGVKNGRT